MVAVDELLEHVPPHPQRPFSEVLAPRVEAVERDQRRRRGGHILWTGADPLEVGEELAVEDRDLAIEDERRRFERGHRGGQLREATSQVATVPTHQAHTVRVLVGEHAPAVDFLLVDPAVVVDGALHFGRGHRRLDGEGDSHR
jgi:hypothetical protein